MKRLIALLLILALLPLNALAAQKKKDVPAKLTLSAGKFQLFTQSFTGDWESSDPAVANAEQDVNDPKQVRLIALSEGSATLTLKGTRSKKTATVEVTVLPEEGAADSIPALIQSAIDTGISEFEEVGGQPVPREKKPKNNKYTKWWRYDCGWCGAFANYCLDTAGVPLEPTDTYTKLKPLTHGDPHGVREAAVPKLDTGFNNLNRTTKIPRPGYLVIYGRLAEKGQAAYAFVHVGLVTDVIDRGDGVYQLFTVEGNLANTVKRISYLYDARNVTHQNMAPVPQDERTDPSITQYTPHQDNWYVYEFCQTWY